MSGRLLSCPKLIKLSVVFVALMPNLFSFDHFAVWSVAVCILSDFNFFLPIVTSVESSTNFTFFALVTKSDSMWINSSGPLKVPWGTPPLTVFQSENDFPILTHCCLPWRKLCYHCWTIGCTPFLSSFCSKIWWLMWSNALLKSIRSTLA